MALGGIVGVGELQAFDEARNELTDPSAQGLRPRINRALCDAAASNPGQIASIYSPAVNGLGAFCQPYYESNGDVPPSLEPPFEGGQCPVDYRLRGRLADGTPTGTVRTVRGPISPGPVTFNQNPSSCSQSIGYIDGNGNPGSVNVTTSGSFSDCSVVAPGSILIVERVDGLPDDCPNLPGEPTPSPDYSRPRPVGSPTDIGDPGSPVIINIGAPQVDISGELYVPITIGDITVPVNIDTVGRDPDLPTRPQPPASEGEPSAEMEPSGELPEEPTPEEEEQGVETIGYRWNFPVVPPQQPPIPGTSPGRFPLIIGNLQLKYRSESGQEFWSKNYQIREQSGSLLRDDESLKVVGVSYWKRPDWGTIVLTPIKAQRRTD